jgi:ParB family transcriptional regulator, chromosome partitioning protein
LEFIIMEHTKELLSVPLSSLVPSPHNVRRHTAGQVEELAALIDAQGLLHNLMVTEQMVGRGRARKLRFAVAAGERRRRALLLLQQRGRLPKAHEVLCERVPPERALEVSMAENSGREALHPADEFEAFKALIDEGKGIEDVATRFGVSVLTVQRRLKLSAVSPKLLALYREDGINLDQLMALTLSDEHEAQERAWFDAQPWDRTPAALRRVLIAGEVEAAGSALVRFVGIEAYEAAGGVVRRDLFDDAQSRFFSDAALVQRLATDELETLAEAVRAEGWAWVEARLDVDSHALRQFVPCEHSLRRPTKQEKEELAELDTRARELEREGEALNDAAEWSADDAERIDLEEQAIEERRKAIHGALKTWPAEAKQRAGVIVTVGREGDAEVIRGLMRDADRKAWAASQRSTLRAEVASLGEASGDPGEQGGLVAHRVAKYSDSLMRRLAAHRTVALQVMLSRKSEVALAAVAHVFVQRVFGDEYRRAGSALQITPQLSAYALQAVADDLKQSTAWQTLEAARLAWKERLPANAAEWFGWLVALPQPELLDLLALCSASTLNALPNTGAASDANALTKAVGLDMADWWEPTALGYLNHVSKAQIADALSEAGTELAADEIGVLKKDALVARAASQLAGKRWLPPPLRPPPG